MTTDFVEHALEFSFGSRWNVIKYDEHRHGHERFKRIQGTRGADFVGQLDGNSLFLIEVKDFRRARQKDRTGAEEKIADVALKSKDTVAGVIGAYRTSPDPGPWQSFACSLADDTRTLKAVFVCVEAPRSSPQEDKVRASVLTKILRRKLDVLVDHTMVVNLQTWAKVLEDVTIQDQAETGNTISRSGRKTDITQEG